MNVFFRFLVGGAIGLPLAATAAPPPARPAPLAREVAGAGKGVQQLQQQVSAQERQARQAADRLREQDRAIAELRRQLRQARTQAGHADRGP